MLVTLLKLKDFLLTVLEFKSHTSRRILGCIYNNLGATNITLGRYDKALEYYNKAETLISKTTISTRSS